MDEKDQKEKFVKYWIEKCLQSLEAAEDDLRAGRLSFSVNRIYYACFYIVSALLLQRGFKFKKHSGVKASFHKNFVKQGLVSPDDGRFYNELFEARQRGDYIEFVYFEKSQVEEWLNRAKMFVDTVKRLIEQFKEK
ncbi:MAG: HEPN domain-containing protein [Candidatus Desulfofervidus auxilii]|nr:HEPN domain-containing protein [Candidatus Desulfofervidus auxilii]